jgi:hypothetical protein
MWMLDEAERAGLWIDSKRLARVVERTPPCTFPWKEQQHESLTPLWWPAEFFPKRVWNSTSRSYHWAIGEGRHRKVLDGALLHESTLRRIRDIRYSPENLTSAFLQKVRNLDDVPKYLPYEAGPDVSH